MSGSGSQKPNHLAGQTSPYLLQHLYNPVDWHPWGKAALQRARDEDRPIFLSIGYAACHWCHVMERESFENPAIAELLNRNFVPIKVDREERPDIDEIYMNAVQVMQQQGGWPLSVFLTPDLEPFTGGTYFPPESAHGRIGFADLLDRVHQAWTEQREQIDHSATRLAQQLQQIAAGTDAEPTSTVGRAESAHAAAELARRFDPRWGGFSPAPKFPPDGAIGLLLREHGRSGEQVALQMAVKTLDCMALGGMYDHVGGGFARYSVDEYWLVPHFEKMLYNQALLVPMYLDGWVLTEKPLYRRVVRQTLEFVRREMTSSDGGFYSSLDADSEGHEGKFYVWTPDEILTALGPEDGARFNAVYGITESGNFEGKNIPCLLEQALAERALAEGVTEQTLEAELAPLLSRLLAARELRIRPGTDDKILTAWNGLMITAFARAHQLFGDPRDLASARSAARFVLQRMTRDDRLLVSFREGQAHLNAYLDDYAFFARGLVDLYEAGFDPEHLLAAERITRSMVDHFEDRERGGFFFTSDDHESLLVRNRSLHDGALPAGNGVAAELLQRLAAHLDDAGFREAGRRALEAGQPSVARSPSAFAALLAAGDFAAGPTVEIAIVGERDSEKMAALLHEVHSRHIPRKLLALATPGEEDRRPLFQGKTSDDGEPRVYVCRNYACQAPTGRPEELGRLLDKILAES